MKSLKDMKKDAVMKFLNSRKKESRCAKCGGYFAFKEDFYELNGKYYCLDCITKEFEKSVK